MANERLPDETQPLLSPPVEADLEQAELSEQVKPVNTRRPLWQSAVYGVLSVLGIGLVALFIKGFIDADDVDVGFV